MCLRAMCVCVCDEVKLDHGMHAKALKKKIMCTIAKSKDMHFGWKFIDCNVLCMVVRHGMAWYGKESVSMTAFKRP